MPATRLITRALFLLPKTKTAIDTKQSLLLVCKGHHEASDGGETESRWGRAFLAEARQQQVRIARAGSVLGGPSTTLVASAKGQRSLANLGNP